MEEEEYRLCVMMILPLQEHDQVQKAASQRGQAPREEEEGARRAGH